MWILVSGSLKIGSVVADWNIPGARSECAFCEKELETATHMFLQCESLRSAQYLLRDAVFSQFGHYLDVSCAECMITAVFDSVMLSKASELGVRRLVVLIGQNVFGS